MNYDQKVPGMQTPEQAEQRRRRTKAENPSETSVETLLCAELLKRLNEEDSGRTKQAAAASGKDTREIDLVELLYYLLTKVHLIVLAALVMAVLLGLYASYSTTPIYAATSKLYIVGQSGTSIIADLQIGSFLTMDYQEVFKTWEVHQMVNEELGTHYSYSQLQSMLTVENPEDTQILYITVQHPEPKMAADIANAYGTAAKRFITETMGTDEPSTFSVALVPSVASSRSTTSYVMRGFLLGTVLAGGLFVLLFLLDNRPKSPEDIMKAAGIPTLAVVPEELTRLKKENRRNR